jgi:hypothetical protein
MTSTNELQELHDEITRLEKEWNANRKKQLPNTELYGVEYKVSHKFLGLCLHVFMPSKVKDKQ